MNQATFLDKLKDLVTLKKWHATINENGEIRLKKPRGRSFSFDPLTAVCFTETGILYDLEDNAGKAGKELGLHTKTIAYLCEASDLSFSKLNDLKLEETRKTLAETLNLDISSEFNGAI